MPESRLEKAATKEQPDELRAEYGEDELRVLLQNGVRGKYAARYRQGTNLVKLAPDIAAAFPTDQAVNDALRKLLAAGVVTS